MRRDNKEFKERFARWKNGEKVYEAGKPLPKYEIGKEEDDFYQRMQLRQRVINESLPKLQYTRLNGNPIKFDEQGNLVDQVTGLTGTMYQEGPIITPKRYDAYNSTYDRAAVNGFIRTADPTGILSIPNAIESVKDFYNNPSLSTGFDTALSLLATAPFVGKYGKAFSKLTPQFKYLKLPGRILSAPISKPIESISGSKDLIEMSRMLHFPGRHSLKNARTIAARLATTTDPDFLYYAARNSSAEPYMAFYGDKFTGSYKYNLDRSKGHWYAGDAAYDDRDLVKTFVYQKDLPNRMSDSLGLPRYKGYIIPTNNDTTYLNLKYKSVIDSLINNNSIVPYNEQLLRKDGDSRFENQYLDNVKRGQLKFYKNEDQYFAHLSDLWDMAGSTDFVGDMFLRRVERAGGSPFYLELNVPIKFKNSSEMDILPTIAPRLTLMTKQKYAE